MKKIFPFQVLIILMSFQSISQTADFNQKVHDAKSDTDILIGYCTRDSLQGALFGEQFRKEYGAYKPDDDMMNYILRVPEKLKGVRVTIVMGTWCSDSQQQVPRYFKLTDNLQIYGNTTIICVDRKKLAGNVSLGGMNIEKVPTFIFQRNGAELGRIIESPKISMERDFFDIIVK